VETPSDLVALAIKLKREEFIARHSHPILLAVNEPEPPTNNNDVFPDDVTYGSMKKLEVPPRSRPITGRPALYAVVKVHKMIPHGIILGRATTSDIVIADRQVSKSHAMFQDDDDGWVIADIGSRNGTCVNERRLEAHGAAAPLHVGDILSFGYRTFFFLDAATCWERMKDFRE
jgi:hypothetical protein